MYDINQSNTRKFTKRKKYSILIIVIQNSKLKQFNFAASVIQDVEQI